MGLDVMSRNYELIAFLHFCLKVCLFLLVNDGIDVKCGMGDTMRQQWRRRYSALLIYRKMLRCLMNNKDVECITRVS